MSVKMSNKTIDSIWPALNMLFDRSGEDQKYTDDELPMRLEIFSSEQMEQHAKALAGLHKISFQAHAPELLTRLAQNESILIKVRILLMEAIQAKQSITPAGEWLLNNFYLIEEQIRTAKRHFPKGYSQELPRLLNSSPIGLPRVYDIVLQIISHSDGRVDSDSLRNFVAAYQKVTDLTLGELWAIPIMLRLALIENLRRIAIRITASRNDLNQADYWVSQITEVVEKDPKNLILVIADMARSKPPMRSSFVAEFVRRLHGHNPALTLPLNWLEQQLLESGLTIDHLVQMENQQQAAEQVFIGNVIGSLRFLSATDWREFVETMSIVEQILRQDPSKIYEKMDFATRDQYRHVVEEIAKSSQQLESEIARSAISLAHQISISQGVKVRTAHVGFYLIDKGILQLKRKIKVRLSISETLQQMNPLFFYLGMIILLTGVFTSSLLLITIAKGLTIWLFIFLGMVLLLGTSQLAVDLVNWLMTLLVIPKPLPRMDFSKGIPPESQTLVVVPTLLNNSQNIKKLLEEIEVRFLANRDENLQFGLLTDFCDAFTQTMPEDEMLLEQVKKGIKALNEKYQSSSKNDIFFLFHRPRLKNNQEQVWMGYERKRGKLGDLNALLRDQCHSHFSSIVGNITTLLSVKYVITLDTDTQLPRDSARQFIGAMAHPLNQAFYDHNKQLVCAGYGILQPGVGISLSGANRSRYAQLYGSEPGIDPYTRAISNVYQDVFDEGSFIGKGIYDVDVFEQALKGRFPENRILSHDLLEGCYVRAGLLSDVQLYEEYPASYQADISRRHRWIRGDWQIASWLLPSVPGFNNSQNQNPLSGLSRWKIFDNLRRSLVPVALTLLLLLSWTVLSPSWVWTVSVIGIFLVPVIFAVILDIFRKPNDMFLYQHIGVVIRSASRSLAKTAFMIICLPFEAVFSLDAIVRTIGQMLFTHKGLLQWNPASSANSHQHTNLSAYYRIMWSVPIIAIVIGLYLILLSPNILVVAIPFLGLWLIAPAIAWWISQPLIRYKAKLTEEQTIFLQKLSRKTWSFFDAFVSEEDNWLPPDNYQEHPVPVIAHRTSPTNIGFALLANLSAYDFGYISAGRLIERTSKTFRTMSALERHRGHFYNWYDTQSLTPLYPLYISSVDSGNLSGHLLALRQGLLSLPDQQILEPQIIKGLRDSFSLMVDAFEGYMLPQLTQLQKELELASNCWPTSLVALQLLLNRLANYAEEILRSLEAKTDNIDKNESQATDWTRAFVKQCQDALNELNFLTPWISLPIARNFGLDKIPTLRELSQMETIVVFTKETEIQRLLKQTSQRAQSRIATIKELAQKANEFAQIEYDFLFDETRHLLAIGYNVSEQRRDASFYDLLASEARLCSFVGIAQGHIPQENWFSLGRLLTIVGGCQVLVSWSGSMFEYLMPLLVMPTYENTLLDQTYKIAIKTQIEYGRKRGIPWGVSESGYNMFDTHLNYQYHAFGVPSLGLNPNLAEDTVIAPYASMLALMVAPKEACLNLQRMSFEGFEGKYGFYEAIDYTPLRLPRGQKNAVVRSFMAHHQGMSFLSLAYLLLDQPMQHRFEAEPLFQATMLLLQERVPKATAFYAPSVELAELHTGSTELDTIMRIFRNPNKLVPEVQLLSNGKYRVMVTSSGGGYSQWKDIAVTRWREDSTSDNWGTFCYIRNLESGDFWSTAYQPTIKPLESYEAIFLESQAEFRCRNQGLGTHTEIVVSPEDDIELRRIRISNFSQSPITIDVTSYAEVVLNSLAADMLHPTFSNLFVQTEILRQRQAILCTRRPRSQTETSPWMFHLMAVHGAEVQEVSYETDRMEFIGRGNTVANPQAMAHGFALSGREGSVLDPIVAIRCRITLEPETSATVNIVSGMGETHELCLGLVEKYQDWRIADRVFDLNWAHSQVVLKQLNVTEAETHLYGRLASSIIYANASLRAEHSTLVKNHRGQSGLWGYSISGDLPIVLLQIGDPSNIDLVRQLVQAHAYWRLKGLMVDLMIWKEDYTGYRQLLHEQIMKFVTSTEVNMTDRPGGIFVRPADQMSNEDRILVQSVARIIISDRRGTLADQLLRRNLAEVTIPRLTPNRTHRDKPLPSASLPRYDLLFFNGFGGFTADGREYIITTSQKQRTPAPWVNILANPYFGTVISESGSAYTWSENAHEFRLTPWHNDPVTDSSGEAFYIRDEERGHYWSPTPLPSSGLMPYISRHGFGYSIFEHNERGIRSEMKVYVALDANVKFMVFKLANTSERSRRISLTGYMEWVLGDLRSKSSMYVITEIDPNTGAMFARNPYNTEFTGRVAFFDVNESARTITGDRTEFIGRNNTLQNPSAMTRLNLSGKIGAALDPCGALQVAFNLASGEEREIIFTLGVGRDASEASSLVQRFRGSIAARQVLEAIWEYWKHALGAVYVETPDQSLNILANGWLLYQTLASRLWARSGYYQSGGAFGFRDQLQDVMALIHTKPSFVRDHILNCASRQFVEGDVQHWWHPPLGRGVRTHCSDDLLWLPLVTCRYVLSTGDTGILEEKSYFLTGRLVNAEEESYYDLPSKSEKAATLYEHCVLAILRGLNFGSHGLPLIGSGDWNDGMNLIGEHGKGESIWLGFFLYQVLTQFTTLARNHGDTAFAERCKKEATQLRQNLDQHGWDGEWYRRAYFDDGSPLGSASNSECKIDSISQSWAVLSGASKANRTHMAMEAVDKHLVNRKDGLIQLLKPPFDSSNLNPGYIKGYVPGIRENGGQYTHAAIWSIMAFAALGDNKRAWELFALINPINHAKSSETIAIYKVEPYVVAADVYAVSPHNGRGGWTWYTGSASWMYQLILESLLGLKLEIDKLSFTPCLPKEWSEFKLHYRYRETYYHITVQQISHTDNQIKVVVDGFEQNNPIIQLVDDHKEHLVHISLPLAHLSFEKTQIKVETEK